MGVNTLQDYSVGRFKATLFALMGAGAMLLMIACGNVANLLLAQATVREKEIAIRASLGASRSRLVRQLLVESFILATASCIASYVFTSWGLKGVAAVIPGASDPCGASRSADRPGGRRKGRVSTAALVGCVSLKRVVVPARRKRSGSVAEHGADPAEKTVYWSPRSLNL
jgi:ABC-type antimicrobial peptide transport system permease subunit